MILYIAIVIFFLPSFKVVEYQLYSNILVGGGAFECINLSLLRVTQIEIKKEKKMGERYAHTHKGKT